MLLLEASEREAELRSGLSEQRRVLLLARADARRHRAWYDNRGAGTELDATCRRGIEGEDETGLSARRR